MTYATYAPRVYVNPDRHGGLKTRDANRLIVVHTSEGPEGGRSAQNLAAFLGAPGDRPNGHGGFYGSSYHDIFDVGDVIPAVPHNVLAWSASGANSDGVHGCFPATAFQTLEQWLDEVSRPSITRCAEWVADVAAAENIPLVRLTSQQVADGASGICGHINVSEAFHKTDHTDPGVFFPWNVLMSDIRSIVHPLEPIEPPPSPGVPDMFHPIAPFRNSDTRAFGGLGVPADQDLAFGLNADVFPAGVTAVAMNVVVVGARQGGFCTVWPSGDAPNTSVLNFRGDGEAWSGSVVVGVTDAAFMIKTSRQAHLVCDVTGYWV